MQLSITVSSQRQQAPTISNGSLDSALERVYAKSIPGKKCHLPQFFPSPHSTQPSALQKLSHLGMLRSSRLLLHNNRYGIRLSLSTFTTTFSEIKTAYLIHLLRSFYEKVFLLMYLLSFSVILLLE